VSNIIMITPLEMVRRTFHELVLAGALPVLDGWALGVEVSERYLKPGVVQSLLGCKDTDQAVRDGIWAELVRGVQLENQPWTLFATGLMIPGLKYTARRVLNDHGGDRDDVESTVLVGFVEALRSSDPTMRGLSSHLKRTAYQRAVSEQRMSFQRVESIEEVCVDFLRPVPLVAPPGHPDLVLARAVHDGALAAVEADIIMTTRLEKVDLAIVARHLRLPYAECAFRRDRAEAALLKYLSHEQDDTRPR
jgi:hypothetical protein